MGYLCPLYFRNRFFLTDFSLNRNSAKITTAVLTCLQTYGVRKKYAFGFHKVHVTEVSLNPCQNTAREWFCSARTARSVSSQSFQNSPLGISHCPWHCCQMKKRISPLQNSSEGHFSSREKLITRMVRHSQLHHLAQGVPVLLLLELEGTQDSRNAKSSVRKAVTNTMRGITESREAHTSSNGHPPQYHTTNLRPSYPYKQGLKNYSMQQKESKRGQNYPPMLRSLK